MVSISKLSKLQGCILGLALDNRSRESRNETSDGADVYYAEILVRHFGFEYIRFRNPDYDTLRHAGYHRFDLQVVGKQRYASASAAVSRACARLHQRGLVDWMAGVHSRWSGVSLTPAGVEAAERKNLSHDLSHQDRKPRISLDT